MKCDRFKNRIWVKRAGKKRPFVCKIAFLTLTARAVATCSDFGRNKAREHPVPSHDPGRKSFKTMVSSILWVRKLDAGCSSGTATPGRCRGSSSKDARASSRATRAPTRPAPRPPGAPKGASGGWLCERDAWRAWRARCAQHTPPCSEGVKLRALWTRPRRGRVAGGPNPSHSLELIEAPTNQPAESLSHGHGEAGRRRNGGRCV